MKFIIVVAALAFSISAAIVSAQETAKDFAKDSAEGKTFLPPPPALPDDWQTISTTLIKQSVRNAETVRIEFREQPYVMTCKKGVFKNPKPIQILMVNVAVNGENGFGGFTGFQFWSVAFTPTEVISYTKADGGAITRFGLCKRS